jgi:hypothetical protein
VIEKESGDKLLEWGAKLFYFDRRKCIQVVNFASKFTLFLIDIKVIDLENVGDMMAHYLLELYKSDREMTKALGNNQSARYYGRQNAKQYYKIRQS